MAAAIKNSTGAESELIRGSGGVFEVKIDGNLVFSKKELGRFPEDEEILTHLT